MCEVKAREGGMTTIPTSWRRHSRVSNLKSCIKEWEKELSP